MKRPAARLAATIAAVAVLAMGTIALAAGPPRPASDYEFARAGAEAQAQEAFAALPSLPRERATQQQPPAGGN